MWKILSVIVLLVGVCFIAQPVLANVEDYFPECMIDDFDNTLNCTSWAGDRSADGHDATTQSSTPDTPSKGDDNGDKGGCKGHGKGKHGDVHADKHGNHGGDKNHDGSGGKGKGSKNNNKHNR